MVLLPLPLLLLRRQILLLRLFHHHSRLLFVGLSALRVRVLRILLGVGAAGAPLPRSRSRLRIMGGSSSRTLWDRTGLGSDLGCLGQAIRLGLRRFRSLARSSSRGTAAVHRR